MAGPDPHDRVQQVVEANVPALLGYFQRRVDNPDDAADLISETLLVLWRREQDLPEDPTQARMWLFGIARNIFHTSNRTHQRRTALHDKLRAALTEDRVADASDRATVELNEAVRDLDGLDQEILRLAFWDGFTQAQIAVLLSMPEGTVRSRTHRARSLLRDALGQQPRPRPPVPSTAM